MAVKIKIIIKPVFKHGIIGHNIGSYHYIWSYDQCHHKEKIYFNTEVGRSNICVRVKEVDPLLKQ